MSIYRAILLHLNNTGDHGIVPNQMDQEPLRARCDAAREYDVYITAVNWLHGFWVGCVNNIEVEPTPNNAWLEPVPYD